MVSGHNYTVCPSNFANLFANMPNDNASGVQGVELGQGSDTESDTTLQPVNFTVDAEKMPCQERDQVFDCGKNAWMTVAGT